MDVYDGCKLFQFTFFLSIILLNISCCCHWLHVSPRLYEGKSDTTDMVIPSGNITIKWDVLKPTSDGYILKVTIYNLHAHKLNADPSWTLGWTWTGQEVIRDVIGAQVTSNLSITNRNFVITSTLTNATNSFRLTVIAGGRTMNAIKITRNVTFQAADIVYNCGPSKLVKPLKKGLKRKKIVWRVGCVLVPSEILSRS